MLRGMKKLPAVTKGAIASIIQISVKDVEKTEEVKNQVYLYQSQNPPQQCKKYRNENSLRITPIINGK
jgi:hypothetical protein